MIAFFSCWAVAILLVLRWFHVVSANLEWNDEPIFAELPVVHPQLSSSAS